MSKRYSNLKLHTILAGLLVACLSHAQEDALKDVQGASPEVEATNAEVVAEVTNIEVVAEATNIEVVAKATNIEVVAEGSNMTESVAVPAASSDTNEAAVAAGDLPKKEESPLVVEEDAVYNKARYQPIVARSPFGEAYGSETDRNTTQALQEIERNLRLCLIMEDDSGEIRAGFQVLRPEQGEVRSVILMKGDQFKGWRLEDIDLEKSIATMNYNGTSVPLELTRGTVAANNRNVANAAAVRNTLTTTTTRNFGGGLQPAAGGTMQLNAGQNAGVRTLNQTAAPGGFQQNMGPQNMGGRGQGQPAGPGGLQQTMGGRVQNQPAAPGGMGPQNGRVMF